MSKLSGTETSTSYLATDGWTFGRKNKLRIFTILTFCTLPPAVFSKIQFKERITHLMSSDYMWISIFQTSSYFWSQGGLVSAGYQTWYHANFGCSVTCDNRARHNWEQGQPGQAHAVCRTIGRLLPRKANLQGWIPPEMRGSPENVSPRSKLEWRKISRCQVVALQSSIYQNYRAIGEVFHHGKDILHPVAELKIINLDINFNSHVINLLKILYLW